MKKGTIGIIVFIVLSITAIISIATIESECKTFYSPNNSNSLEFCDVDYLENIKVKSYTKDCTILNIEVNNKNMMICDK